MESATLGQPGDGISAAASKLRGCVAPAERVVQPKVQPRAKAAHVRRIARCALPRPGRHVDHAARATAWRLLLDAHAWSVSAVGEGRATRPRSDLARSSNSRSRATGRPTARCHHVALRRAVALMASCAEECDTSARKEQQDLQSRTFGNFGLRNGGNA